MNRRSFLQILAVCAAPIPAVPAMVAPITPTYANPKGWAAASAALTRREKMARVFYMANCPDKKRLTCTKEFTGLCIALMKEHDLTDEEIAQAAIDNNMPVPSHVKKPVWM